MLCVEVRRAQPCIIKLMEMWLVFTFILLYSVVNEKGKRERNEGKERKEKKRKTLANNRY